MSAPPEDKIRTFRMRPPYEFLMQMWGFGGILIFILVSFAAASDGFSPSSLGPTILGALVLIPYLIARHLVIREISVAQDRIILTTYASSKELMAKDIADVRVKAEAGWSSPVIPSENQATLRTKSGKRVSILSPVYTDSHVLNSRIVEVTRQAREAEFSWVLQGHGEFEGVIPKPVKWPSSISILILFAWMIAVRDELLTESLVTLMISLVLIVVVAQTVLAILRLLTPWRLKISNERLSMSSWNRGPISFVFDEVTDIELQSQISGESMSVHTRTNKKAIHFASSTPQYPLIRDLVVAMSTKAGVTGDLAPKQLILPLFSKDYDKLQGSQELLAFIADSPALVTASTGTLETEVVTT